MKVLFIVNEFPKLSETFVLDQITNLIDNGHTVSILAKNKPSELKIHPDVKKYNLIENTIYYSPNGKSAKIGCFISRFLINLLQMPGRTIESLNFNKYKKNAYSLNLFFCLNKFKTNSSFDVIQCHFGNNGVFGQNLKDLKIIQGKLFTTFHGYDMTSLLNRYGKEYYNSLFKKGDYFLPISEYWKKKLEDLSCPSEKIIVHKMGVDIHKFNFNIKQINKLPLKVISIARLVEKKGIEFSIKAIAGLISEGKDIEYNIIGDGPLREDLQELINQYKVSDKVKLLGWKQQEEVITELKSSDVNLVPSVTSSDGDMEGIPVVIMESMAMGIPVISSYHSGIPEIIEDNNTGFLVKEKDVEGIKNKLNHIYLNPSIVESISIKARSKVEKYYNNKKLTKDLEKLFLSTVDK